MRTLDRIVHRGQVKWILEADIVSFFDSLDRKRLLKMLEIRVADGSLLRLIGKCLHVGVLEGVELSTSESGTAQGSVLSPLLGNVYLHALLPSNPFTKAAHYALERKAGLEVFLTDPEVPLDTNHLERALRPIPMGRKAWLFRWTELGAERVGQIQSLISTCVLHGVDPYTYLVDVLQRIDTHPFAQVEQLTPRLWKPHFADAPLRSLLETATA